MTSAKKSDIEVLQEIQEELLKRLKAAETLPAVKDLLAAIRLKNLLIEKSGGSLEKKTFWANINRIRTEELTKKRRPKIHKKQPPSNSTT